MSKEATPGPASALFAKTQRGARVLLEWLDRRRQRRALQALDSRALRDIGLSTADVAREAAKPFWRA